MDTMPIRLPAVATQSPTRRAVLWWAAVVAIAMLSFYIHVLHEGVARGERLRESHRAMARSALVPPTMSAPANTRLLRTAQAGS